VDWECVIEITGWILVQENDSIIPRFWTVGILMEFSGWTDTGSRK